MNAKYILSLCFVMNYLVILSVANPEKEIMQTVFNELLEYLDFPNTNTVFVNDINTLLHDGGETIKTNYSADEIAQMNNDGIDVNKFEEITKKAYKTDYVKSMNERFLFIKAQNKPIKQTPRL
ncbi:uncharacterized protein LOC126843423 [Adelges cooleyi]|uniref:uncharacterized protein LOC126843423 n=1 Tax=Adelges cooleyi TaxID=133065 RepID=UPI002180515B|nr:uncharacterized protein LOC126843423 [Adelges cooleyi]